MYFHSNLSLYNFNLKYHLFVVEGFCHSARLDRKVILLIAKSSFNWNGFLYIFRHKSSLIKIRTYLRNNFAYTFWWIMPYSYVELIFNQKGVGFWILYETQPESYLDFWQIDKLSSHKKMFPSEKKRSNSTLVGFINKWNVNPRYFAMMINEVTMVTL